VSRVALCLAESYPDLGGLMQLSPQVFGSGPSANDNDSEGDTIPGSVPRRDARVTRVSFEDTLRILDGRYELRRLLGSGGMANVYLAHDRVLRRDVAIKLVRHDLAADPHIVQRFAREAMALAAVDSPHVVPIHDVVLGEDAYLVLRLVTGRSLDALLALEAPLSIERTIRLIVQVLEGLSALHARRLVHRDLKPANVLVDHGDRAVIIDLGVALDRRVPSITPADAVAGTPEFMAPEHRSGFRVDPRSDIYQVGFLLVHAATGSDPAGLSDSERRELVAAIPSPLDSIARRAIASEPGHRFADASEMKSALLAALRPRAIRRS
jgi:eukaryotic-like serine/threonine-protein kinase